MYGANYPNVKGRNSELVFLPVYIKMEIQYNSTQRQRNENQRHTLNPKILSSSIKTPSQRYSAWVTISTYGRDDRTSSLNTESAVTASKHAILYLESHSIPIRQLLASVAPLRLATLESRSPAPGPRAPHTVSR